MVSFSFFFFDFRKEALEGTVVRVEEEEGSEDEGERPNARFIFSRKGMLEIRTYREGAVRDVEQRLSVGGGR